MVFQPSSSMNSTNTNQNSAAAPAANPVTPQQVQLQQPTVHQFQQSQQSMPIVEQAPVVETITQHSSDNTSNDEIQELLVSVLEELCTIKSAIFEQNAREQDDRDDQDDPTDGEEPMGEAASSAGRVEAKAQYPESVNTDLFASCFQE